MSMRFDIITIFSEALHGYFNESIISRAQKNKLVNIKVWDLRKFSRDKHKKVDDKPYGGGPGMVLKIEPIAKALESILKLRRRTSKSKTSGVLIVLLSVSGKQFNSKMAADFAKKYNHIILIAGHYEGIDERIKKVIENWKLKIENLSVGPYVLTGGELPAMVIVDAVSRHIRGVLGKAESLEEKRHGVGVPVYTRPEIFKFLDKKYKVPPVLLSGNHRKINVWRKMRAKWIISEG